MAFDMQYPTSGDFKPIIKYDARAGRVFRIERNDGVENMVEITNGFTAILDLKNVETGWAKFVKGAAPEWHLSKIGQRKPDRPSIDHKVTFRMIIKLAKNCGGDVREFASSAKCVVEAMDELHSIYKSSPEASKNMLPVVTMLGSEPVTSGGKDKTSTNYKPKFEIKSWVERPADMPDGGNVAPSNPAKQPPQTSVSDDMPEF